MSYFVVDVESDGEYPPDYSIVCFGVVRVDKDLQTTFYGEVKPISKLYKPDALAISGFNRKAHETFGDPFEVMPEFAQWLIEHSQGKPTFISDNLAFDWQWINYYLHKYAGSNPFGHSGRRIGDLYCGLMKNGGVNGEWKRKYRITRHTHNPVDDAKGNAEALLTFRDKLGLKIQY
jgi:hypothetical protein